MLQNEKEIHSEKEKIHQVFVVMSMLEDGEMKTEKELSLFLFEVAKMNAMATKGYMCQRTSADYLIYATKKIACEFLAKNYPTRCSYNKSYRQYESVLYIYSNRRQYSFHVEISCVEGIREARFNEWDNIERGWAMSDEEYRNARQGSVHEPESQVVPTLSNQFQRKLQKYKAAKEYRKRRDTADKVEAKFWKCLLETLPKRKQQNKCVAKRDARKCYELYFPLIEKSFSEEEKKYVSAMARYHIDYYCYGDYIDQLVHNGDWRSKMKMREVIEAIAKTLDSGWKDTYVALSADY